MTRIALALALVGTILGRPVAAQTLANAQLRATFRGRGLASITDVADGRTHWLRADDFALTIDGKLLYGSALPEPVRSETPGGVRYRFRSGRSLTIDVSYELKPGWRFVSKQITVRSDSTVPVMQVNDVTLLQATLTQTPTNAFRPTSAKPSLGTLDYGQALRFGDGHSLLMVAQNPFVRATLNGSVATLRYAPEMEWKREYGAFVSDRALIAPVRLSGRVLPAQMIPEWRATGDDAPGLDEAEIASFTGMVRSLMIYQPKAPLNVFVGWCVNDYQIDVGTEAGRAEYRRVFDQASATGAQYVLYAPSNSAVSRREDSVDDWSWEHVLWLGLGQKIRRNEWNPRTSAIPPSVQEMVQYAGSKQLKLLAYVYPVLPFSQNPAWLVPARANSPKQVANLGNRALQDWLIEELVAFHARTGIAGYSFDHTFLTYEGTSRYAQWSGWRRVMEELRKRIPDIVLDGRQAHHLYGPWSYLAGSYPHPTFHDEQPESFTPYPDLHFDRVSANRERYTAYHYRNYEFTPSELVPGYMTHQTSRSDETDDMPFEKTADRGVVLKRFRERDWDYLGWRYSVLSSIAVGGWNNVMNFLPARDSAEYVNFAAADRSWLRGWLQWTATNKELLRHTRTILGQPRLGHIDGTAAIVRDRGFIFLFNPDAQRLSARVALDAGIGLTSGARYELREVYPVAGRRVRKPGTGVWQRHDTTTLALDGGSAMVLEVVPVTRANTAPVLYGSTGNVSLANGMLRIDGATGEAGTTVPLTVTLPVGARVTQATVNGVTVPLGASRVDAVELSVTFSGAAFRQMQPVIAWDSTFSGGRASGTFTIPKRVFDQLRARRNAWPIPWTAEDYRTTWLVPERLLLYAPFTEADTSWNARLLIDGKPVEFRKAYTAVRAVRSTFTGFYADLSALQPDTPYRVELELPQMKPGQFRGLYFENIEPAFVSSVIPPTP